MLHARRADTQLRLTPQGRCRLQQKLYGAKPWETLVRLSHQEFPNARAAQSALYQGEITWSGWKRSV